MSPMRESFMLGSRRSLPAMVENFSHNLYGL
jgi:hypothetical protein